MWLLPSRGRRDACQDALDACAATGMSSPLVVIVDSRVDDYCGLRVPGNVVAVLRKPWDLAECSRWLSEAYPDEACYGWLADDLRPRTFGWDAALERACKPLRFSHCYDGWMALDSGTRKRSLCGAFCWDGDLVRTVGWFAPTWGVHHDGRRLPMQGCIDDCWTWMFPDRMAFVADHLVEHWNYRTGRRAQDQTDDHSRGGDDYIARDVQLFEQWRRSQESDDTINRVRAEIHRRGIE